MSEPSAGNAGTGTAFGWAPVGARLLREYSTTAGEVVSAPTVKYAKTWTEIKALPIIPQLVELAVQQMALLHAVDTMPRGGLCQGPALKEALRRYERLWLPLVAQQHEAGGGPAGYASLVPPPDVALLWHLHRLQPEAYAADCREVKARSGRRAPPLHVQPAQAFAFSDGSDAAGAATAALWAKAHGPKEPFWPPAPPGPQTAGFRSRLGADLAAVGVRVPVFTHQLLRAAYCSRPFLERAVDRYAKFLLLRKHHLELQHPIPPLDIALMWACHMSASGHYAADCQQLLQRTFLDLPGAGASLWLERDVTGPWRFHWTDTQRAWMDEFSEPFVVPASGYVPLNSPHPAEALFSPALLAAYEEGSGQKQAPWRAGAHALYLAWLRNPNLRLQQQYQQAQAAYLEAKARHDAAAPPASPQGGAAAPPPPPQQQQQQPAAAHNHHQQQEQQGGKKKKGGGGGLFACFSCGGGADTDDDAALDAAAQRQQQQYEQQLVEQQRAHQAHHAAAPVAPHPPIKAALLQEEALKGLAAGFPAYKNLPLTASHPYWLQLAPRGGSGELPLEEGAEVEVLTASAGSGGGGQRANGGGGGRDGRLYDQDVVTGDYEVAAAGGQALMW